MKILILILIMPFIFAGCESLTKSTDTSERPSTKNLSENYARYRSEGITGLNYQLEFDLTDSNKFTGKSNLFFNLEHPKDLTIDFMEGKILKVSVNGSLVTPISYNSIFLDIPEKYLKVGNNEIAVSFSHEYSSTPAGLYRYVDPADKKVYLYSHFEPYSANKMFPCFDQPDLKATYTTKVTTPRKWKVVTSNRENSVEKQKAKLVWNFPASEKFSTYIYSLHAGEYKVWEDKVKTKNHTVPLRLFARQSLAKYVNPKEWFSTTQSGFKYFENYFGYPYPFHKYDQLIVPEFYSGAMENVGAVTFHEWSISRTKKERDEKRGLANTILHELAHMWFGNLVTMEWWNDIWLNESFASYLAYKAMADSTPYKEAWTEFYMWAKRSAYFQDQSVTTHPITFDVPNTDVVFSNFDGITYGKGASTLKQLEYFIGANAFQKGLDMYFKSYAFKNTQLKDFMASMESASGKNLSKWNKEWLQTPQVNSIALTYNCKNGKITNALLKQTAVEKYPVLRNHKTQIGVFQFSKNRMALKKKIELAYSGSKTSVPSLDGLTCGTGTLIYPNIDDFDYAKVVLDPISLKTVEQHISSIDSELLRVSLWGNLWDMVRDQKLVATKYYEIAINNLDKESKIDVLTSVIGRVGGSIEKYFPTTKKGKKVREKYRRQWVQYLLKRTKTSKTIDEQKRWFDYYLGSLETEKELDQVAKFLDRKPAYLKFKIDQERRWRLLRILSSYAHGDYKKRLEREAKKDKTQRGKNGYLSSKTLIPDIKVKEEKWAQVIKGPQPGFTLPKMQPVIFGLFPSHQENIHRKFADAFFKELKGMNKQPPEFLRYFVMLAPDFCTNESAQKLQSFVDENDDLKPVVTKSLKIRAEEDRRCVKIRNLVAKSVL